MEGGVKDVPGDARVPLARRAVGALLGLLLQLDAEGEVLPEQPVEVVAGVVPQRVGHAAGQVIGGGAPGAGQRPAALQVREAVDYLAHRGESNERGLLFVVALHAQDVVRKRVLPPLAVAVRRPETRMGRFPTALPT